MQSRRIRNSSGALAGQLHAAFGVRRFQDFHFGYVFEFRELRNQSVSRAFRLHRHLHIQKRPVRRGVGVKVQQIKAPSPRHAQHPHQRAFRMFHPHLQLQDIHSATSSIISEFDFPGPTIGHTFAS